MLKRTLPLFFLLAITITAGSCIFDPKDTGGDDPAPARPFLDRTEQWHVINNIELAYNRRLIEPYRNLLDESFTFFLSPGDVGGTVPDSWGRDIEVQANENLFVQDPPGDLPPCKNIRMNIQWEKDPASSKPEPDPVLLSWIRLDNSGANSDETWFTTTVFYDFDIRVDIPNTEEDLTYQTNNGAKAQFTVRQDVDGKWKLVEFRDLGAE
ncbi:MAG TPA: hypothetical protein VF128_14190 [Gemmatimonadaceae bacterium]